MANTKEFIHEVLAPIFDLLETEIDLMKKIEEANGKILDASNELLCSSESDLTPEMKKDVRKILKSWYDITNALDQFEDKCLEITSTIELNAVERLMNDAEIEEIEF